MIILLGFLKILEVVKHLSTDRENKNIGEQGVVWKLIEDERKAKNLQFSMLKSVCAVYSPLLASKDAYKEASEVDALCKAIWTVVFSHLCGTHKQLG